MRHLSRLFLACTVIAPLATLAADATNNLSVTASVKASCAVDAASINFGAYDPIADSGRTSQTNLKITCTKGHPATISLSNGANYTAATGRQMADGNGNFVAYDLYQGGFPGAGGTRFGTAAGETLAYVGAGKTQDTSSVTVYAAIGSGQDAAAGTYTDTVTININY